MTSSYIRILFVEWLNSATCWADFTARGVSVTTFKEAIDAFAFARASATETGTILIGTGANGASASKMALPMALSSLTPESMAELAGQLLSAYQTTLTALTTEANPTPTPAQVYTAIAATYADTAPTDFARRVRAFRSDFSRFLYPGGQAFTPAATGS